MNQNQTQDGIYELREIGSLEHGIDIVEFFDPAGQTIGRAGCKSCAKKKLDELIHRGLVPATERDGLTERIDTTSILSNCANGDYRRPTSISEGMGYGGFLNALPFLSAASSITGLPTHEILSELFKGGSTADLATRIVQRMPLEFRVANSGDEPAYGYIYGKDDRKHTGKLPSLAAVRAFFDGDSTSILAARRDELVSQATAAGLPEEDPAAVYKFGLCDCGNFPIAHGRISDQFDRELGDDFVSLSQLRSHLESEAAAGRFPADQADQVIDAARAAGLPAEMSNESMMESIRASGMPVIELHITSTDVPVAEPDPEGKFTFRRCEHDTESLHGYFYSPRGVRVTPAYESAADAKTMLDHAIEAGACPADQKDKISKEIDAVFSVQDRGATNAASETA